MIILFATRFENRNFLTTKCRQNCLFKQFDIRFPQTCLPCLSFNDVFIINSVTLILFTKRMNFIFNCIVRWRLCFRSVMSWTLRVTAHVCVLTIDYNAHLLLIESRASAL